MRDRGCWRRLVILAALAASCTPGSDESQGGPLEPAPEALIGHWVPAADPIATFVYTELATPRGSLVVDVTDVAAEELEGLTVVGSGLIPLPTFGGDQPSYFDGSLSAEIGEDVPVAEVFVGQYGDQRNSFAYLTVKVDAGRDVGTLSGVKVRYRLGDETFALDAPHSFMLCVGEPTKPCAPAG